MEFRTEIKNINTSISLSYTDRLFLIGSCFASNIGNKLLDAKFQTLINPFGVLYNPVSILNSITQIINKKTYTKEDLIFKNGLWNSFDHHSSFSSTDIERVLNQINLNIIQSREYLKKSNKLLITLGSSFIYKHIELNKTVSNCHKIPQKEFKRFRLTLNEASDTLKQLIDIVTTFNSNITVIFTVSPIRYIKDGFEENQRSKSTLLLAIDDIISDHTNTNYFSAYEIMMDDLRDYRFYDKDLIHPNELAIDYIWGKFKATYFGSETSRDYDNMIKICKALNHKPFNPNSEQHQKFLKKQINNIEHLTKRFPTLSFENELKIFNDQIIS